MKRELTIGTLVISLLTSGLVIGALACAGCGCSGTAATPASAPQAKMPALTSQTICPVMGNKVDKKQYVDVKGLRVYVCCAGCIDKIKENPDKYLARMTARGEMAAPILCGKCGERKSTAECCKEGVKRCGCGAIKGSPGCCKLPEKGKDVALCVKCGEIAGTVKCCKKKITPTCGGCPSAGKTAACLKK